MQVAVVVPVLDEVQLLPSLRPSLAGLAAESELIVVDGGSRDGTLEALREHAASSGYRIISAARGRASQMNAGAGATTAPVILFLHADTVLPAGAIATVERTMQAEVVAGCFRLHIASSDPRLQLASAFITWRSRLMPSATGDQAIFVDRRAFESIGGYLELALCEDLDLIARLRPLGAIRVAEATVSTSARRWQARGVNRTIALMWAIRVGCHLGVPTETLRRLYADAR